MRRLPIAPSPAVRYEGWYGDHAPMAVTVSCKDVAAVKERLKAQERPLTEQQHQTDFPLLLFG